jgi:hypothetical protein
LEETILVRVEVARSLNPVMEESRSNYQAANMFEHAERKN